MKNPSNKERLNLFLAEKLLAIHNGEKTLVITVGNGIITNENVLKSDSMISSCTAEEADQKLVRHMLQCVKSSFGKVVVRTVDTDVVISLLAYRHRGGNFSSNVFAWFGMGKNSSFYNINDISLKLGEDTCQALPFFHSFTGCDTVSSFFNHGKCKFWDRWREFEEKDALTRVFVKLSEKPTMIMPEQVSILESYVLSVYYNKVMGPVDIDFQRMHDFEHSVHSNLRLLPPSKLGLIEHIKRASYEAGWVVYQCKENVELPNPKLWVWKKTESGQFEPKWQNIADPIDAEKVVTATCSCVKAKCTSCQCSKQNLQCITFCKCQRLCIYKPI